MTGSLFSLPGTQYINVEHIHLVEERERQLPKDRRPRIQQGFAASLFLPLFLFSGNFWLQMTFRGEQTHFIGGPGACRPATGRQEPCRPMVGRQAPRRTPALRSDVSGRVNFAKKNPCRPATGRATGFLSPSGRATGFLSPNGRATGVHFCKISKVRSKNVI